MHRKRLDKHGTIEQVNKPRRRSVEFSDDSPIQRCTKCSEAKARSEFHRSAKRSNGLSQWCRTCSQQNYYVNHDRALKSSRSSRLLSNYGLTVEEYDVLLVKQGGVCAICGESPREGERRLAVDHDHSCCPGKKSCGACIRGLLCANCNPMLGYARDDVGRLSSAIEYLVANQRPLQ